MRNVLKLSLLMLSGLCRDNKKKDKLWSKLLCSVFLIVFLISCHEEKQQVFYDLSFEEIAEKACSAQKKFCLVLSEGSCPACEKN